MWPFIDALVTDRIEHRRDVDIIDRDHEGLAVDQGTGAVIGHRDRHRRVQPTLGLARRPGEETAVAVDGHAQRQ